MVRAFGRKGPIGFGEEHSHRNKEQVCAPKIKRAVQNCATSRGLGSSDLSSRSLSRCLQLSLLGSVAGAWGMTLTGMRPAATGNNSLEARLLRNSLATSFPKEHPRKLWRVPGFRSGCGYHACAANVFRCALNTSSHLPTTFM